MKTSLIILTATILFAIAYAHDQYQHDHPTPQAQGVWSEGSPQ